VNDSEPQHGRPLPDTLDWEALEERGEPPVRDWAIEHWLGMGHVTLLAGRGGIGKSIIAQQLGTALALGRAFVGAIKRPRVTLMWAGEDDHDELWRRQRAICQRFSVSLGALRNRFHVEPLATIACSLFENVQGDMIRTSMLAELRAQIEALRAEVVILDNIARLYGGSENDRHHVSTFLAALGWAAEPTGAAVLLLGHVAKNQESEYAGSTAWENAARGRLWLTDKPPDKKPDTEDDETPLDLRYLAKRKVNYTSNDIAILRYTDGAYDVIQAPARSGMVAAIDHAHAAAIVLSSLSKLIALNFIASDARQSHQYLPGLILEHQMAEGFTKRDLTNAMHALVTEGKIVRTIEKAANRSGDRIRLTIK
jgi:putative DNA primase/helicase